ncbi:pectinesterase [Sarracenia purpurea var. burkii]
MTHIKDIFAGVSDSGDHISMSKRSKNFFLLLFASTLLIAAAICMVAGVNSRIKDPSAIKIIKASASRVIVESSCSTTLYPDLCYSAIASVPGIRNKVLKSQKDVILTSLDLTIAVVKRNYLTVERSMKTRKSLTERQKTALHDCLETIDETLDDLRKAEDDLNAYAANKSSSQIADHLKTLMSAAMTNQETCLDGFAYVDADRRVRETLLGGQVRGERMCSNALAMIKNLTDTDIAANEMREIGGRKLEEEEDRSGWPEWLPAGDRRLLQSSTVSPDVVVAADGSGNYRTVTAAVAAAPEKSSKRYIIRIKAGVYRENVDVSKEKTNIMLVGDDRRTTIITASRNVVDGSTTFRSATVDQTKQIKIEQIWFVLSKKRMTMRRNGGATGDNGKGGGGGTTFVVGEGTTAMVRVRAMRGCQTSVLTTA